MSSGIKHERRFGTGDPFAAVAWEGRTARIKDDSGKVVFEQEGFRVPASWSQLATDVVASKFAHGPQGSTERESGADQIIRRVTSTIAGWGREDGVFDSEESADAFQNDLDHLCINQYGAFNSPVWFNVGVRSERNRGYCWRKVTTPSMVFGGPDRVSEGVGKVRDGEHKPQGSACFIQSVKDDMDDIMRLAHSEASLFKNGSGTGTDLSTLRSTREKLSGGGTPSGPVSFFSVYDAVAKIVKSGGRTRRAARMQTLKCFHPDLLEFIECKAKVERIARALIACGFDDKMDGEVYASLPFQSTNTAVRYNDEFLSQADADIRTSENPEAIGGAVWKFRAVTTGEVVGHGNAGSILRANAEANWSCGDPGVQFEDTINRWHTCPEAGLINSSNPCSEFMFLDDSSCNLASINLLKFRREDGSFDAEAFAAACRVFIIAQEILVDHVSYPTEAIARNSHDYRPLGLGYANLGGLLMASGLPYDSEEGRKLAAAVTSVMNGAALLASAELAEALGPYPGFEKNREHHLRVARMHQDASVGLHNDASFKTAPEEIAFWGWSLHLDAIRLAETNGFRNAQVTLLAPTGTIAFLMDCDTTGIEPDIALVKYKALAGGGTLTIVNRLVPTALRTLGYGDAPGVGGSMEQISLVDQITNCIGNGSDYWRQLVKPEHHAVFATAFGDPGIGWRGHVEMMAAVQPFLSGAISKTVNMPASATVDDIVEAYLLAWRKGIKALAVYRDGSKGVQPVTVGPKAEVDPIETLLSVLPDGKTKDALLDLKRTAEVRGDEEVPESEINDARLKLAAALERAMKGKSRKKLPETCEARRGKFRVAGFDGYVHAGLYPDGRVGELFITAGKDGSTVAGLLDLAATMASIALQHGCPLESIIEKMRGRRFEPHDIRHTSIPDAVAKWLEATFVDEEGESGPPEYTTAFAGYPRVDLASKINDAPMASGFEVNWTGVAVRKVPGGAPTGKTCPAPGCGSLMFPNGSKDCWKCPACGAGNGSCGG